MAGLDFLLDSYGPHALGRLANGWLPSGAYAPLERLPEMQQLINDAALAAGRLPQDICRIYNVMGSLQEALCKDCLQALLTIGLRNSRGWHSRSAWTPSSTGLPTMLALDRAFRSQGGTCRVGTGRQDTGQIVTPYEGIRLRCEQPEAGCQEVKLFQCHAFRLRSELMGQCGTEDCPIS